MQGLLRFAGALALGCMAAMLGDAPPARAGDCRSEALSTLRAASPDGYAVYLRIKDKTFFTNWISCTDDKLGLPTAVHESIHYITSEIDAFPLLGGGEIKRPHQVSKFFPPTRIASRFKATDYVGTYLRLGSASSASDFLYLLDEFNAYTHDLATAVALEGRGRGATNEQVDHRDGLASMMAFMAIYVQTAEDRETTTWKGLQEPEVAKLIGELWSRAETVMASSCRIPNFGTEDRGLLRQAYQPKAKAALEKLLGRAPITPADCIAPAPKTAQGD